MKGKASTNFIRFCVIPLALCAAMFNARCKDDNNDEFYQQALLNLVSCKGGTMAFTVDALPAKSWTCCVTFNHGSYWEVVGRGNGEVVRIFIGDATVGDHSSILKSSYEYIVLSTGGTGFYGVHDDPYDNGSSTIDVDSNTSTAITGTFSGTVYAADGSTNHVITGGTFNALK